MPTDLTIAKIAFLSAASAEVDAIANIFSCTFKPDPASYPPQMPLDDRLILVRCGVGKAASAAAAACLAQTCPSGTLLISIGIAGAVRGRAAPLDCIVASRCAFADEGVHTSNEFTSISAMGFGSEVLTDGGINVAPALSALLLSVLSPAMTSTRLGPISTVSTCSGTDDLAKRYAERTENVAEAMEGAAIGQAVAEISMARGISLHFAEVRIASNFVGDRASQAWQLREALICVGQAAQAIAQLVK